MSRSGAGPAEAGTEDLAQPVPGGQRRVAQRMLGVGLLAGDPPARPGQPDHLADHLGGTGDRHQQGAGVHQIEDSEGRPVCLASADITSDVGQPVRADVLAGQRDMSRVGVQPHHPPARRDRGGQQVEDPARAAAEIDGALPGFQADAAEQRDALGTKLAATGAAAGHSLLDCCPAHRRPRHQGRWLLSRLSPSLIRCFVTHAPSGRMAGTGSRRPTADLPLTYQRQG